MKNYQQWLLPIVAACALCIATQAQAKGCNGVVSQAEWGCAAWDNNNGPQFPHYKKPAAPAPKAAAPAPKAAAIPAPVALQKAAVIAPNNGSGIVASGGGNARPGGAGIVASGGGNVAPKNGSGIVASGGGNLKK